MRYLEESKSQGWKTKWWLPGAGRKAGQESVFVRTGASVFQDEESHGDGW